MSDPVPPSARWPLPPLFLLLLVLVQGLLVMNPGYFSHDELQWGARADVDRWWQLPWVPWFDIGQFQWRPLTFNGWMVLSWTLFRRPEAMHLAWVLAGSGIGLALARLLSRMGAGRWPAVVAALVFVLCPYAAYVQGWVATLADLLWVGLAVALAHVLLTQRERAAPAVAIAAVGFAATGLALMAKEAALAIPAGLGLCWLLWRDRSVGWATLGAAAAATLYLAVRLPVLLSPGENSSYALTPATAPQNWLAYHLFVLRPSALEVHTIWLASAASLWIAGLLWLALWVTMWRADRRLAAALVLGGVAMLAPALPLVSTANQYAYAFSLWTVACVALAWPRLRRPGRALVLFLALVSTWHGVDVQREMRAAGERQAVFQPALVQLLAAHPGELRLYAPADYEWVYRRVTHDVWEWRGEPLEARVVWVATVQEAQWVVADDGSLKASDADLADERG